MHRRDLRGLISRPTVTEAQRYRASIDSHIENLLFDADEKLLDDIEPILVLGRHHEQQHQELLITDIKHVFAQNPLYPVFRAGRARHSARAEERTATRRVGVPTVSSISRRQPSRLATMAVASPMTTKGRGIKR